MTQKITIDGKDYAVGKLSEEARNQVVNLRVCDQEIAHLKQRLAIAQTARAAYASGLRKALASAEVVEH
ncbi:hypothetical protein G3446_04255 [Thiorhodococcus minor]|uniref:Uncharacterized protein n=2 Tax=Thiorhodococcus minor TaxID=57489 RepID=A0A6M0JU72_9GAMM|nr:DUF6447 family protein [Thiorhodococcus minor]NEV61120.1 hypothetical protein [Thiorhodococcus minor]